MRLRQDLSDEKGKRRTRVIARLVISRKMVGCQCAGFQDTGSSNDSRSVLIFGIKLLSTFYNRSIGP